MYPSRRMGVEVIEEEEEEEKGARALGSEISLLLE